MIAVANLIEVYGDDIDVDAVAMPCAPLDSLTQTTNLKMMPDKKSSDIPGGNCRSISLGLETGGCSRPSY